MASAPTPMFTSPLPSGKIQPYPGSTSPVGGAQLQVRGDPRLAAARRGDVARGRPRRRPFPGATRGRALGPVSSARRRRRSASRTGITSPESSTTADTRPDGSRSTSTALAPSIIFAPSSTATSRIRSSSSVRGTALLGRRERRPRPRHLDVGAEPRHPQSAVRDPAVEPGAEPEAVAARRSRGASARRRTPCRGETRRSRSPARRARRAQPTPPPTIRPARRRRPRRQRCSTPGSSALPFGRGPTSR